MELNFDNGVQSYEINGKCTITMNPTDYAFVDKMFATFTKMEKKDAEWRDRLQKESSTSAVLEVYRDGDDTVRRGIDEIFGDGVADKIFEDVNCMAFGSNGLPIWMNFILAIMDTMNSAYAKAQKDVNPAINKYLKKYHR